MFRKLIFLGYLIFTITLIISLNVRINDIPPVGKFLNPYSGFWVNGEKKAGDNLKKIILEGIKEEVIIQYDSTLVPHIYTKNDKDLFYAQGYLTAFHRLWQMEFQIKAASGELSEILGEQTLKSDISKRRNGIMYAAKRTLKKSIQDEETLNLLDSYVSGVNDYINSLNYKDLPVEYKILDYKPEKWTLLKTFILMEYMSDMLSRGNSDIEDTYLINELGIDLYNNLFPEYYNEIKPIIPDYIQFDDESKKNSFISENINFNSKLDLIPNPNPDNGSNNFAISPKKSKDGSSYLASQPDLSLNLPSIWYLIHLNSPNFNTMGASLPGAPGIIIGFNDNIAWGETNATRDVVDWYKIEFKDSERKEYRYGDKWLKTEKVIERFKVRGEDDYYDTIIFTHYGPVVYDKNFGSDKEKLNLAMRWIAHDESVEYKTFLLLNKAKNIDDIENALEYFDGPAQNFAYATKNGDIGLTIAGKFPIKYEGQGKFILDGKDIKNEWQGYIPYKNILTYKNPKEGYVSSANQHPVNKTYPYYYYSHNYEMYRGRRLIERLESIDNVEINDIKKIQNDNFNYKAYEVLPLILDEIDTNKLTYEQKIYFKNLKNWDYFAEVSNENQVVFNEWWNNLYKNIWDEFDSLKYPYRKPNSFRTYKLIKEDKNSKFYDVISTSKNESLNDLINKSFLEITVKLDTFKRRNSLKKIKWDHYKNTTINHLLRIKSFSYDSVSIGGYRNILNAASERHGPSFRLIVKLKQNEKTKAWGVYPGGQSGNIGSQNYFGEVENWGKGVYNKLLFNSNYMDNRNHIIFEKIYNIK